MASALFSGFIVPSDAGRPRPPAEGAARRGTAVIAWALLAALPVTGAPLEAPLLLGPEIVKLDWNTRGLVVCDLDGDGRQDIAVINNDRARIELLFQRNPDGTSRTRSRRPATNRWEPELEDARFDKQPLSTGGAVYCLAAGDLNGDGRTDLAYTGDPDAVTVRLQSPAGDWDEKRVLNVGTPSQFLTTVTVTDYNGDGRDDLVLLLQDDLVVLRQTSRNELAPPVRFPLSEDHNYSLRLADLNGDGRRDVIHLTPSRRDGLRVRLQLADGTFGPEIPYRIEVSRTALELVPRGADLPPGFAHVQNQTALLAAFALAPSARPTGVLTALKPRVFSPRTGAKNAPSHALGDIDGDGRLDIAVADPDGAQLLVYFQSTEGTFGEARSFPSVTEARALAAADWDGDGRAELFLTSTKEQTLTQATFTSGGRLAYPQPLPVTGKPVAVDAGVLAAGQLPSLAVAVDEGGRRRVEFLAWVDGAAKTTGTVALDGLRTDPRAVRLLDVNQDNRLDVAVFVPFEPVRLLLQNENGTFRDLQGTPGFRRGLVENLDPAAVTLADIEGDGHREMLVASSGMARVLRVDEKDTLYVADQFNAREANADITAAFATDVDGDGVREVILLDRRGEQLQVLRRNEHQVFEYADTVPVGRIDLLAAMQADYNSDGRIDLFLFGKDRFWLVPTAAPDFVVDPLFTYETDLRGVRYGDIATGDLNGDGVTDFVLSDPQRNLVEILLRDGLELKSVLHFQVFEADPHVQNRGREGGEPREMVVADVTGDGKNDLILLVHDRLLVYRRE